MEITIFAKKRTTSDGRKTFFSYLTTLTRKNGTPCTCAVKFAQPAEPVDPVDCPCNILVEKQDCNLTTEDYTDAKTDEVRTSHKLWVKGYKMSPNSYVDHSMDDFF